MTSPEPAGTKKSRFKKFYWPLRIVVVIGFLELLARQFIARPNRIVHSSSDPDLVYTNAPGTWLGHAKFEIWTAPIYMVLDLVNTGTDEQKGPPPPGYTIYRIDKDGCRVPQEGAIPPTSDVILLGSSQSFGLFVPAEDTASVMLERDLRARGLAGATVANCGVIGHHLLPTLRSGELERTAKNPKVVAILVRPWHLRVQFDYTNVIDPDDDTLRWVTHHSSFARALYYYHRREPSQFEAPLVSDAILDVRLDRYAAQMKETGVRTIFFLLDDKAPDCVIFDSLGERLAKKGFTVERIPTPSRQKEYFVDHDRHWSAKGAALMASEMIDTIARELTAAGGPRTAPAAAP